MKHLITLSSYLMKKGQVSWAQGLPWWLSTCLHCRNCGCHPWVERPLGKGNGNPLQKSRLGNPRDRRAWRATVHGVTEGDATQCQTTVTAAKQRRLPSPSPTAGRSALTQMCKPHRPAPQTRRHRDFSLLQAPPTPKLLMCNQEQQLPWELPCVQNQSRRDLDWMQQHVKQSLLHISHTCLEV